MLIEKCSEGHLYGSWKDAGCPVCASGKDLAEHCGHRVNAIGNMKTLWCSPLCARLGYHAVEDREEGDD